MSLFDTPDRFKISYRREDLGISIRDVIKASMYAFGNEYPDEELVIEIVHNYHLRKWGLG